MNVLKQNRIRLNVLLTLFFTSMIGASAQQTFPVQSKHSVTKETVDIVVTDINGNNIPLNLLMDREKNYVVSIMASWCGPCKQELSAFQKVYEKWLCDLNTEVIGISIEKPTDTYKLFNLVKKQNWTIPIVHDKMAYTSRELGVFDIPQTFLINKNKEIVFTTSGYKSNLVQQYEEQIVKLN